MLKKAFSTVLIMAGLLVAMPVLAQDSIEGKYTEIKPALPTQTGDKIEVIEVFWYGCPHCYSFEPYIEEWLVDLPEDVEFIRVPGVLNQGWIPHAKAYYTAEKLGVLDKTHRALFDALHKEKRQLFNEDAMAAFFAEHGVSPADFSRVFNSKEIDTKIRQAYFLARDYKLTGVPSIVVNGKYMVSASAIRTFEEMLGVTNALIDKER